MWVFDLRWIVGLLFEVEVRWMLSGVLILLLMMVVCDGRVVMSVVSRLVVLLLSGVVGLDVGVVVDEC